MNRTKLKLTEIVFSELLDKLPGISKYNQISPEVDELSTDEKVQNLKVKRNVTEWQIVLLYFIIRLIKYKNCFRD